MLFLPRTTGPGAATAPGREASGWMVAPMLVGIAVLLVLGVHPPGPLVDLISRAAAELGGGPR
jgi:hydrogenase-4 component F